MCEYAGVSVCLREGARRTALIYTLSRFLHCIEFACFYCYWKCGYRFSVGAVANVGSAMWVTSVAAYLPTLTKENLQVTCFPTDVASGLLAFYNATQFHSVKQLSGILRFSGFT